MWSSPKFLGLHADPPPWLRRVLAILPFILLVGLYLHFSNLRLQENEQDKLLPSAMQMVDAAKMMAFEEDKRSGQVLLWADTLASLRRLGLGMISAAFVGLFVGLFTGLFRGFGALLTPFMTFVSIVPPLAILPILFITFGVDEFAKIVLIFIGTFPVITRDIYASTKSFPVELLTKSKTLGATSTEVALRIVLPQLFPKLLETIRLTLGSAWLFLIAAEAIAATEGLGYRIFLVRRYLAMDIIIPYVLWITLLGYLIDFLLQKFITWRYPWHQR
jgi:NitT/TauT family transport system permease protein